MNNPRVLPSDIEKTRKRCESEIGLTIFGEKIDEKPSVLPSDVEMTRKPLESERGFT